MIVTTEVRNIVYAYLFKEGVLVATKDFFAPKHHIISQATNREVICMMNSLKSRGYVRETFNWGWFYWYLTATGVNYLREYLHLPAEVVPATLKATRPVSDFERSSRPPRREGAPRGERPARGRGGFRRGGRPQRGERPPRAAPAQ